jgi:hypothetical protein
MGWLRVVCYLSVYAPYATCTCFSCVDCLRMVFESEQLVLNLSGW